MIQTDQIENQHDGQPAPARPQPKKGKTPGTKPSPERIRVELNIEKWPAIWNPTHSKNRSKLQAQPRILERETSGLDGTKRLSKVTINPIAHLGDLTTDDYRTLNVLIKHWEERGKPQHETPFSIRHVAKLLRKKGWGTNVIDAVTGSLERLRGTMLVWTRSYRSKDQRVEDLETVYVNILSKLKIVRRKVDGHVTTEAGYFQFDDHILKNLLTNYTKPFLFDVFIDIKGEIALKLYSHIDMIMADKNRFERRTKELFEDLGLMSHSYRNPSKRKQNLQKAFDELTGIMLTTGVLKSATIEKTKDGQDYKAVFQKVARSSIVEEAETTTRFIVTEPVIVNDYSKQKTQLTLQAEELVRHFHLVFHGVTLHTPLSKETDQAESLVSQHGLEKSKWVVEFARDEAAKSKYPVQHFGAVLSYTHRALSAITGRQASAQPAQPAADPKIQTYREERKAWKNGEARLGALNADQYWARFGRAKAGLFQENSFLARNWKEGSEIHERTLRARVIRELETEPMDLVLLPPWLTSLCQWHTPTQNLPL